MSFKITDQKSGALVQEWTSLNADKTTTNPGALDIELDIPVYASAQPGGSAIVRVWGISLQQITNAFDLNDRHIEVHGGSWRPSRVGVVRPCLWLSARVRREKNWMPRQPDSSPSQVAE